MEEELISIIIPVYKVENYLEKCVDSVINQTYKNLEIILIDDGSPDNSGAICDEYAKKDSRIKVIHKKNGGLSDARNAGLKVVTGKYIGFVDSDDYIEKDMFETMYKLAKMYQAEISIVSYAEWKNGKILNDMNSGELNLYNKVEAIKELLIDSKIQSYMWNKLFKNELFEDIEFPVGKNFEDIATTLKIFEKCNKIVRMETAKYNYIRRDDSIIGNRSYKTYNDYLDVILDKYLYLFNKYPEIEEYNAYNFIINMLWVYTIIVYFDLNELYEKYDNYYPLFRELVVKYKDTLQKELDDYNKILLHMIMLDKKIAIPAIKELYNSFKIKRENGEFLNQI